MNTSQNYTLVPTSDCIPQRDTEEWFEDASSEADWFDQVDSRSMESSTGCSIAGSITLLDEIYEKNKMLEKEWRAAEQKYQNLKVENQKLTIQLANERHRANKYQRKLQYIQDHQEIFKSLKEAYLSLKYNETTGSLKEIKERACQTWDGVLCEACIETAEFRRRSNLNMLAAGEGDVIPVKKNDLAKLQNTVQALKSKIDEREKSWSFNVDRENKYKATIAELQANIELLQGIIAEKCEGYPAVESDSVPEVLHEENELLKKIIIKMEKRYRDMAKMHKIQKCPAFLTDQEKYMIQQLIKRYNNKLRQKTTRYSPLENNAPTSTSESPIVTPRTPRNGPNSEGSVTAAHRSLPTSASVSPRTPTKMPKYRPNSEGTRAYMGGEGEVGVIPLLTLHKDNDAAVQQAEKPLSPRKTGLAGKFLYQENTHFLNR